MTIVKIKTRTEDKSKTTTINSQDLSLFVKQVQVTMREWYPHSHVTAKLINDLKSFDMDGDDSCLGYKVVFCDDMLADLVAVTSRTMAELHRKNAAYAASYLHDDVAFGGLDMYGYSDALQTIAVGSQLMQRLIEAIPNKRIVFSE